MASICPHPLPSVPPRGSNYTRLIIKVSLASAAAPGERSSLSPSRGTECGTAWGARLAQGAQAPQGNSGALVSPVTILCPIFSLPLPRAIWGSSCGWLFARPHALPGWQGARSARGCAAGRCLGTRTPGVGSVISSETQGSDLSRAGRGKQQNPGAGPKQAAGLLCSPPSSFHSPSAAFPQLEKLQRRRGKNGEKKARGKI